MTLPLAPPTGLVSQDMGDRFNEPEVVVSEDTVRILLTAQRLEGGATCPSNPSRRVEIELQEPLGDREIRDGNYTGRGDLGEILRTMIEDEESP